MPPIWPRASLCTFLLLFCRYALAADENERYWTEPQTKMEFAYIPAGCYTRPTSNSKLAQGDTQTICMKGFWMGRHEVTQAQYQNVVGKNPSFFAGDTLPVDSVSFDDAVGFANRLARITGERIRLPSEAEWEAACRPQVSEQLYCGAKDPSQVAWFGFNSERRPHPVGTLNANQFGLHDMNGNVWEWTLDCWQVDEAQFPLDGSPQKHGQCGRRVMRGGSWNDSADRLAVNFRDWAFYHRFRFASFGFRLVREDRSH